MALDWLILSTCKSRRRGPGVYWPNYAKHITHQERWRLGRMGPKLQKARQREGRKNAVPMGASSGKYVKIEEVDGWVGGWGVK